MPTEYVQVRAAPFDLRILIYRILKQLVIIGLVALAVKLTLLDTVLVRTNQMEPSIANGDRVLLWRAAYAAPLKWFVNPRRHAPVVFRHICGDAGSGCLRIAGKPGDVVSISNAVLSVLNEPTVPHLGRPDSSAESLPPEYSPRDWLEPYYIPRPGERLRLDTLALRDFIFAWAIIRQENPAGSFILQPWLHINDSLAKDYFITDFSLYRGPFNAVPQDLSSQWFFWDRLLIYLQAAHQGKKVELKLSIMTKGTAVVEYRVKEPYYFLIADNWREGFDSRYFGPVGEHRMLGTVVCALWSFEPGRRFPFGLRGRRICRIIH